MLTKQIGEFEAHTSKPIGMRRISAGALEPRPLVHEEVSNFDNPALDSAWQGHDLLHSAPPIAEGGGVHHDVDACGNGRNHEIAANIRAGE